MSTVQEKSKFLGALPPIWTEDLLPYIQSQITSPSRKIIVLDDDPTGTQTVHGVPVLTTWTVETLAEEFSRDTNLFYILTNSRSLTPDGANTLAREIGANLAQAAKQCDVELEIISRSDSTLRGHFPEEIDSLVAAMGETSQACLIAPFFLEGGRYTIHDEHYVAEGETLVPAAQTPYAQDAVFGYKHSNLCQWVEEKTKGKVQAEEVTSITLDDLRQKGPEFVGEKLAAMQPGSYGIVNAADYRDLEVLVAGLIKAEAQNRHFIFRTAACFVRVRGGISPRELLDSSELTAENKHGGLFVAGSYVPKTTAQLNELLKKKIEPVEISVDNLLSDATHDGEIQKAIDRLNHHISQGRDAVVFTSRKLITGTSDQDNLSIGQCVSDSLISIVHGLEHQPRYLVAKGGITSSDVATKGLGVLRAMIMGQILPGVPVWKLGPETRYPGMAYIVFPGNVGNDDALAVIQERLAQ